ncbi:MAG: response regulator [Bacteroidota bacterium]|nr:response regulator [Candidatus Kapabacteria bacterium]MDW8220634.1 response regulator [Bacteroidota bacterium]
MKKILIIEDEKNIRRRIVDTLELADNSYCVFTAEHGREGLEIAQREKPDLIISDIMMPEMDGYAVLKALRSDEATASIPIVFLSAKADIAHIREGMNLGADDYLPKPFSIDELLRVVSTRLQRQETQAKRAQHELEEMRLRIASSLPHEFRTPLSALMGFTEMLRNYKHLDDDTITTTLNQIRSNIQRLQRLVENFLLFAQIEVATLRMKTPVIFPAVVETFTADILEERIYAVAAKYQRVQDLRLNITGATLPIATLHLRKILEELTDNACKFSPSSTPITIRSAWTDTSYTLSITDEGRGMTQESITHIDAYMQFERELYEQQGVGLGLALVKRIVSAYRGTINIQSEIGKGTQIVISFPIQGSA